MRIFTKYNRVNILATIIIFLLSSLAFYFAIRYILIGQVDDDLRIEQREIETYVREHNTMPESISVNDQKISYALSDQMIKKRKFSTSTSFDTTDKKESYRILQFGITANSKIYTVTVAKSLESTDALTTSILLIVSTTILLMLIVSFFINRILLRRLWRPFYQSLEVMKNFRIENKQSPLFSSTNIDEFVFMNDTLQKSATQAQKEYSLLREFTENASHEMQTPLAIIRSKLDLLIQNENLSEEQSKPIQSAYNAIEKLSKLNQSLLLLAKIENNQFGEMAAINMKQRVEEKLEAFSELWQNQQISITTTLNDVTVTLNNELCDILLNNLLSNATRHNYSNGFIKIILNEKHLEISNSSAGKSLQSEQMFSRFSSARNENHSSGLGLSIIKQICDVSGFRIQYLFTDDQHRFVVSWHP
jgi:signal transduction histidine kinase